ncbi:MAG: hypothetical protein ABIF19_09540 [Planctomycetota bacterium]
MPYDVDEQLSYAPEQHRPNVIIERLVPPVVMKRGCDPMFLVDFIIEPLA